MQRLCLFFLLEIEMKVKTSELQGAALNWAVAKAIGEYKPVAVPNYSTDWAQGGPIIEREELTLSCHWQRSYALKLLADEKRVVQGNGPTPLIAAMRCYVASKLGDEIDVPNELTGE
jgi:hypothetical protein